VGKVEKVFEVLELRAAVVEAARAYAKYKPYDDDVDLKELGRALRASIAALERAEKGES
jgi:hypothetical protein